MAIWHAACLPKIDGVLPPAYHSFHWLIMGTRTGLWIAEGYRRATLAYRHCSLHWSDHDRSQWQMPEEFCCLCFEDYVQRVNRYACDPVARWQHRFKIDCTSGKKAQTKGVQIHKAKNVSFMSDTINNICFNMKPHKHGFCNVAAWLRKPHFRCSMVRRSSESLRIQPLGTMNISKCRGVQSKEPSRAEAKGNLIIFVNIWSYIKVCDIL